MTHNLVAGGDPVVLDSEVAPYNTAGAMVAGWALFYDWDGVRAVSSEQH